jgi:large exoprotein involved in heme utilization and adhesion
MSGLGFTHWGVLVTIAFSVSFCTIDYANAKVTASTSVQGNAGNITINSGSFSSQDGAQITAVTFGQGNAGTIKVNATDFLTISGSDSNINSSLFANSQSTTGTAGDIIVTSPRVTLDNSSGLNAQSSSGNGGNISLQTDLLLLRRGAQISTTAGTAQVGGDGGNITINTTGLILVNKPVPEPALTFSMFINTAFYAAWRLKRKQKQTAF